MRTRGHLISKVASNRYGWNDVNLLFIRSSIVHRCAVMNGHEVGPFLTMRWPMAVRKSTCIDRCSASLGIYWLDSDSKIVLLVSDGMYSEVLKGPDERVRIECLAEALKCANWPVGGFAWQLSLLGRHSPVICMEKAFKLLKGSWERRDVKVMTGCRGHDPVLIVLPFVASLPQSHMGWDSHTYV